MYIGKNKLNEKKQEELSSFSFGDFDLYIDHVYVDRDKPLPPCSFLEPYKEDDDARREKE